MLSLFPPEAQGALEAPRKQFPLSPLSILKHGARFDEEVVADALLDIGLCLKEKSLQVMPCGSLTSTEPRDMWVLSGDIMEFKTVDAMELLGTYLDNEGSTISSLDFRIGKAEACAASCAVYSSLDRLISIMKSP